MTNFEEKLVSSDWYNSLTKSERLEFILILISAVVDAFDEFNKRRLSKEE